MIVYKTAVPSYISREVLFGYKIHVQARITTSRLRRCPRFPPINVPLLEGVQVLSVVLL